MLFDIGWHPGGDLGRELDANGIRLTATRERVSTIVPLTLCAMRGKLNTEPEVGMLELSRSDVTPDASAA